MHYIWANLDPKFVNMGVYGEDTYRKKTWFNVKVITHKMGNIISYLKYA